MIFEINEHTSQLRIVQIYKLSHSADKSKSCASPVQSPSHRFKGKSEQNITTIKPLTGKSTRKGTTAGRCDIFVPFVARCTLVKSGKVHSGSIQKWWITFHMFKSWLLLLVRYTRSVATNLNANFRISLTCTSDLRVSFALILPRLKIEFVFQTQFFIFHPKPSFCLSLSLPLFPSTPGSCQSRLESDPFRFHLAWERRRFSDCRLYPLRSKARFHSVLGCFQLGLRFRKFLSEIKWIGPFGFVPTGIFGTCPGGCRPLWPVGPARRKFGVPIKPCSVLYLSSADFTYVGNSEKE